jgi:hypothetical protein
MQFRTSGRGWPGETEGRVLVRPGLVVRARCVWLEHVSKWLGTRDGDMSW